MASGVTVVEYDPHWVKVFERIRDFVTPVLSDLLVTVEHIGSTAVSGLVAKPIVDLDVVVDTQSDVRQAITRLPTLGYVHEGDLGVAGREALIPPDAYLGITCTCALRTTQSISGTSSFEIICEVIRGKPRRTVM